MPVKTPRRSLQSRSTAHVSSRTAVALGGIDTARAKFRLDADLGSLGMVASGPGSTLHHDGFAYFAKRNPEPCVFCPDVLGGSIPGGSVPGGTSVELGGAMIGGVLPSCL